MTGRICPECDNRTDQTVCPKCGSRTFLDRKKEDTADPMIGRVLDERYRIEAVLGRGGMGAVYRAVQLATRQIVAIKVILSSHAAEAEAVKRFHREARAASLLTHPHTIRVFDFGQSETGDMFMVMEHLNGRTLTSALRSDGRITEERIAKIACEICQSLAEAHSHGLAHRDLKPDNIMLLDTVGDPEFVKVLDFGIAKFLSGSSSGESSVTRSGAVVGTPHYMSPEQAQGGRGVTPAVDVYALGVIVWEAVAGLRPFDGDSALNVLMAHVRQPVPELPAGTQVSNSLRNLIRRMLAKQAEQRPSAAELVKTFDRIRCAATSGDAQDLADDAEPAGVPSGTLVDAGRPPSQEAPLDLTGTVEVDCSPRPNQVPGSTRHGFAEPDCGTVPPEASPPPPRSSGGARSPARSTATLPSGDIDTLPRSTSEIPSPRPRRLPLLLALAGVAVVGLGAYWAGSKGPSGGTSPAEATQVTDSGGTAEARTTAMLAPGPPPITPPPVEVAPQPTEAQVPAARPPIASASVRVRFESIPSGATVMLGNEDIGTTPFEADVPGGPGSRTFTFSKAGYRTAPVTTEVAPGTLVTTRLVRPPSSGASGTSVPPRAKSVAPAPAPKKKFKRLED